jgi:ABC-type bacteriocin/lantibiotic exporter with double-glycine peptidase domain
MPKKSRKKYAFLVITQMMINSLDLIGIGILTLFFSFVNQSYYMENNSSKYQRIEQLLDEKGISQTTWTVAIASVILLFFLGKSTLNLMYQQKIINFLAQESSALSAKLFEENQKIWNSGKQKIVLNELTDSLSYGVIRIFFGVLLTLSNLITDITLLIFICGLLLSINFTVTTSIIVVAVTIAALINKLTGLELINSGKKVTKHNVQANTILLNTFRNYREIHVRDSSKRIFDNYRYERFEHVSSYGRLIFLQSLARHILDLIVPAGIFVVIVIQVLLTNSLQNLLQIGIFLVAATRIAPALLKLQTNFMIMKSTIGEVKNVIQKLDFAEINKQEKIPNLAATNSEIEKEKNNLSPIIEFSQVSFSYENSDKYVLKNVSFQITKGQIVAFQGESGAGKSTILDLMIGLMQPQNGSVKLFGMEPNIALSKYREKISYVPQDGMIIDGSIYDNICFGHLEQNFPENKIWRSLEIAQLDLYVKSLPNGIYSQVGEFGILLSAGQRQRICIARSMLCEPEIIILDEATNALNNETENAFFNAIKELEKPATVILVSHSKNVIKFADTTFRMKDEHLIEIN